MLRPWRVRYAGAKYRLTVRGNGRATVFVAPEDYARFLEQVDAALAANGGVLCVYVLDLVESMLGQDDGFLLDAIGRSQVAQYLGDGSESAVGKARKRAQAALVAAPEFGAAERKLLKRLSVTRKQDAAGRTADTKARF